MTIKRDISFELMGYGLFQNHTSLEDVMVIKNKIQDNNKSYGILVFNRDFIDQETSSLIELKEHAPPRMRTSIDDEVLSDRKLSLITNANTSGSGQFTGQEFKYLLKEIKCVSESNGKTITDIHIIDLRKEDHGFINNFPVMVRAMENNVNKDQDERTILSSEAEFFEHLVGEFGEYSIIGIASVTKKFNGGVKNADLVLLKHPLIETEGELVERVANEVGFDSIKVHYHRLPVQDYHRPSDQQVDEFIKFFRNNSADNAWQHFHCSAGKGRTTTFEVMNEILTNAEYYAKSHGQFEANAVTIAPGTAGDHESRIELELNEILLNHYEAGGALLIPGYVDEIKEEKQESATERYEFLKDFYEYAIADDGFLCGDHNVSWQDWL